MNLDELWIAIRARWLVALSVLLLVFAIVCAATFLRTPQYTAAAAVVLDVKSPDPIAGGYVPGMTTSGYMATQVGVVQSERVALRAIEALGLDQNKSFQERWRAATGGAGDIKSWIAQGMASNLDVTPTKESNVINLSYTSPNPEYAMAVANAWVKAYIDTTLELRVEPARQYNSFFEARSKVLRADLEAAQAKLSSYQQRTGIVVTEEKVDVESLRLAELTSQLVALQAAANESSGRQAQSVGNASQMREVFNNPLVIAMSTELARYQSQLNELSTKLGDNHPEMMELRAKIDQIKSAIDAETKRIVASMGINNQVDQTKLGQLQAALADQRAKLLRLKGQRDELSVLQRDVENAQRVYDTSVARTNQTGMESLTTQTNVSILKRATLPLNPSSPRIVLNLAIGVLVGCFLAVAAALLREARDRRLRTNNDVLRGLRQPLLGVLPTAKPKSDSHARLRLTSRDHSVKTA